MKQGGKILKVTLLTLFFLGGYAVLAYNGWGIPCLIKKITGLDCPGCGNTRASLALLRFDIKSMLQYNLFFPLECVYVIGVYSACSVNYIKKGKFSYHTKPNFFDISFLVLLVLWTVVRNVF